MRDPPVDSARFSTYTAAKHDDLRADTANVGRQVAPCQLRQETVVVRIEQVILGLGRRLDADLKEARELGRGFSATAFDDVRRDRARCSNQLRLE